ncbi:phosphoribosylaminoimidazolesuccinocarboxamide synthase [Patescibacteria group bacterium]|nr:phosphoribosylaminoimidazolesuccinocarboxamide synthase [Patescibacteria group bacterium]MCL5797753.1 phosphoribosylaminoimidazolesuccinocarboxamide synthase [Patescibacteria group bacterium]
MLKKNTIQKSIKHLLRTIELSGFGDKHQGKVRDIYLFGDYRILITTDRISAFDRVLGYIPYKGQVLNQLSQFWFEKTKDIVANHLVSVPHPNVAVAKNARPYPVEMVVRGYISGVTKTSIWKAYESGERVIYGIKFPHGLSKNQKLERPVITPTTKAEHGAHDERLTREEIISRKLVKPDIYHKMEKAALALFARGSDICKRKGLILVDTKYEFADYNGQLMLIDEIHTPDSSRFWKADTYRERFAKGLEPENFDKEFLRLWYAKKNYRGDGEPPNMSKELQIATSERYIKIYEMITGRKFIAGKYPLVKEIALSIKKYFS